MAPFPLRAAPGTTAASFLDLGYGARAVGLGDAFVSVADDVSALHYNPAGLAFPAGIRGENSTRRYELLLAESLLVEDVRMAQIGLVRRPFGLSLTRMSLGGIEQRSAETDAPEATIGASDLSLGLSWATKISGVGIGVTGKYIRENIGANTASAFAGDLGALARVENMPLSLGLSVANAGTGLRYIERSSPLPLTVRAGATWGLTRSFPHALTLQIDVPRESGPSLHLGAEYAGFGPLRLRFGYQTQSSEQRSAALGKSLGATSSGFSEFYGLSMGAGVVSSFGTFDYAIVPYGELGLAQRFSFSHSFGGKP